MKNALLATFAAALIASVAVPAMAAQRDDGPRQEPRFVRMMERFDANRDGTVSMDEVAAHRLAMFESADTDKSGSLSKDELKAFGDMRKDMRDQNRDDRRAERDGKRGDKMMGRNGDRDGMRAGKMGKHGDRDGRMADNRDGKRMGQGRGEGRSDNRGGPRMDRLDTDKNGEISLAEFAAMDTKLFDRLDHNGDKKIDITDFYAQRANNN